jgi:hypothetical protein
MMAEAAARSPFQGFLYNTMAASRAGVESTGNAARGGTGRGLPSGYYFAAILAEPRWQVWQVMFALC